MRRSPRYDDVHEIRSGLFLGSRPGDPGALAGRFEAILDLRSAAADLTGAEFAGLGIDYRHFPMADGSLPDGGLESIDELVRWIRQQIADRHRVLVHCDAGVSRSATVVALYLIRTEQLGADEAISVISAVRPIVQPHGVYRTFLRLAST